jgi:hypothetical protein
MRNRKRLPEIHREVARLLGQPCPGRTGCDTEDVYLAGSGFPWRTRYLRAPRSHPTPP